MNWVLKTPTTCASDHPLVKGNMSITPDMALRLSKTLGRNPESWLAMQYNHDQWRARKRINLNRVGKLEIDAA